MEGMVVNIIYLIWLIKSVPAIAGAKFVVSDNGDILSPKYDPDIIAPPVKPSGIPRAFPIPNIAIPIVAMVDQLLPVANETIEHIIQAATKKIEGLNNLRPK